VQPQISAEEYGPEPSLYEIIRAYYKSSGMDMKKAEKCRDQYIAALSRSASRSEVLEEALVKITKLDCSYSNWPREQAVEIAQQALASRTSGAGVESAYEKAYRIAAREGGPYFVPKIERAEHEPEHPNAARELEKAFDRSVDGPASAAPDPHDELIFDGQLDQGVPAAAPSVDYARGLEDAAKECERFPVEGQNPLTTMARAIRQDCANAIRAKIKPEGIA
jgi:hypothetical protein